MIAKREKDVEGRLQKFISKLSRDMGESSLTIMLQLDELLFNLIMEEETRESRKVEESE
jgi:hypothetical protein